MTEESPDPKTPPVQPTALDRFADRIDATASWISRHWLLLANIMFLTYVGVPMLAPALMEAGATTPARVIYTLYIPFCHQLPERSYFLFGEQAVYSVDDLRAGGVEVSDNLFVRRSYIGDHDHGYKTALCQRDLAIYGSMFLMGLLFALVRGILPRINWKWYLLFLLPMALDGFTQLFGFRTSNWQLRTLTGVIFGVGTIWFAYPYVAEALDETRANLSRQAADG